MIRAVPKVLDSTWVLLSAGIASALCFQPQTEHRRLLGYQRPAPGAIAFCRVVRLHANTPLRRFGFKMLSGPRRPRTLWQT